MDNSALPLAGDFPPADLEDWRELVAAVLTKSGRRFDPAAPERALAHRDYDGIEVAPLYTQRPATETGRPGQAPFVRGALDNPGLGWDVRARYFDLDAMATNAAVRADLDNGVSSLWLPAGSQLAPALAGVYLDLVAVVLDDPAQASDYLALVADLDPSEVRGSLGADPISRALAAGHEPELAGLPALFEQAAPYRQLIPLTIDGLPYHEAGGSPADELAITLAVGVAVLRAVGEDAFDRLEFRYAVTADQFGSIAKLRAARRLWDRVGQLCGLTERRGQRQHAVTSPAMLTRRDPWVNLLRSTVACFAAAIGGAEAITVLPFDAALGRPDDFGRRIARNTQSILHDEASLARVVDAAGGSYYVETATEELAQVAWRKFTELEAAGGALAAGAIGELVEVSWRERRQNLATRRDPLTGISEFANAEEQLLTRPPGPEPGRGGLPRHRYAEEYEAWRDRSDAMLAATGHRPRVVLAVLGPPAAHSARLAFARNLFAAGGVHTVVAEGSPAELATAFSGSGAAVACLCSADSVYAEAARPAAEALVEAGAEVWIAGPAALVDGPISDSIQLGCDVLAALEKVFARSPEVPR